MTDKRRQIDWDAAKRQLALAESALEKTLVADPARIDEVYRRRAARLADRHAVHAQTARAINVLVFSIAAERYGIPIGDLAEVLPPTRCTPVPRAAAEIVGVINLRGELRSVIDLRRLLSVPAASAESAGSIVMIRTGGGETGLKVGDLEKVHTIREDELASPEPGGDGSNAYIKGLSPEKIIVLNIAAICLHPVFGKSSIKPPSLNDQ
jgi:purine-binding chemotaxis protein CheW